MGCCGPVCRPHTTCLCNEKQDVWLLVAFFSADCLHFKCLVVFFFIFRRSQTHIEHLSHNHSRRNLLVLAFSRCFLSFSSLNISREKVSFDSSENKTHIGWIFRNAFIQLFRPQNLIADSITVPRLLSIKRVGGL